MLCISEKLPGVLVLHVNGIQAITPLVSLKMTHASTPYLIPPVEMIGKGGSEKYLEKDILKV